MATTDTTADSGAFSLWCDVHLQPLASVGRATRSSDGAAGFDAETYAQANLLEVQFADGSVYYTDPQEFAALHPDRSAARSGGANGTRAAGGRVLLPFDLAPAPTGTRSGSGAAAPISAYRLARLTEPTTLDKIYQFGALFMDKLPGWFGSAESPAATALAGKLCRAFENSVLDASIGQDSGVLLAWDPAAARWAPAAAAAAAGTLPRHARAVLMLHGTASSTQGSFNGMWAAEPARPGGPQASGVAPGVDADFARLAQGTLLLAFEHRSLTVSPLFNVIELLRALDALQGSLDPALEINLLSHSRGGLVGELLCTALGAAGKRADTGPCIAALRDAYPADHPDQPLVAEFETLLQATAGRWAIGSFVRVACPARGTLLADRRTDLFLSLLLRSLGLALGGVANPWFEALQRLVRALVATRAEAHTLPGLEAMIPGAPLSRALNDGTRQLKVAGRLRVVAGDSKSLGWGGVLSVLGDVFYGLHDHDFVVHTHSMFGGYGRDDARSLRVEDKSVTHFGYFKPGSLTRAPILAALAGVEGGFNPLLDDEAATRGLWQMIAASPNSHRPQHEWLALLQQAVQQRDRKPILVVLPGIMGSELAEGGDGSSRPVPVWLSGRALLGGGLERLELTPGNPLKATAVMAVAYERLLKQAGSGHHCITFPYDWRRPITEAGDTLYTLLHDHLLPAAQALGVPLHLLAHSMGGLVARAALFLDDMASRELNITAIAAAQRTALWSAIGQTGGRLLMLGTPNQGSYAPVQLLLQQHSVAGLVATAASKVSGAQLAQWGGAFPGLMTMLPAAPDPLFGNLFTATAWAEMRRADAVTALPQPAVLARAQHTRQWLDRSFEALKNDPRVLYVAGQGATPLGLKRILGAGGAGLTGSVLRLGVTQQGDGTVPWDSVLRPERTWYVGCAHGDLPDRTEAYPAYFELLTGARTALLSQQQPASRAGDDPDATFGLQSLPSLPADPSAYVLGVTRQPAATHWVPPIEVRVVHGSLDYARHPLMVGHYLNDSLMGAVKRVDQKLGGQLGRMVDLKLFVGAARTTAYLRPPTPDAEPPAYPGGVVLGLGAVGELTPATLADTVTRGVLRYAFEHAFQDAWVPRDGPLTLRLSTLLIGTHVQAVSARDSLAGVLHGVWRAGQILAKDSALARSVRVAEIEVMEINETTALDAAYQLRRLLARAEWAPRFRWSPATLEVRDGGLRVFRPTDADSIWQRLCVGQDDLGGLKFELISERARVESTRVHAAVASLTEYIARVSDEGATAGSDSDEQATLGRVLYQLLLPQTLKSRLANFEQTVLVLDDAAAALPWELLTPPTSEALGQDTAMPLAVQAGMVRQRVTSEFRSLPQALSTLEALVVGAPGTEGWTDARGDPLSFSPLPGAEREAAEVSGLLRGRQWQVKALPPGCGFERVRTALYEKPWRVLHLCGHGVVDQWIGNQGPGGQPVRRTGMVLSRQQLLSAGDVEQMDPAPEFVFINCCYSGREGQGGRATGVHHNDPMLAASLALQFIRMGAKAVVAAGWRVDDDDGLAFAGSLYEALLQGLCFGDAVREARRAVHRDGAPRSNTWGAYQCYGDPQWRLVAAASLNDPGSGVLADAHRCMSKHELAARVMEVVAIAGDKAAAVLQQQLDTLIERLRQDPDRREWLRSSRVRAALGEAYRELGAHTKALTWLQRAAKTAYSRLELRHLELGVNSLSRWRPSGDQNPHAGHHAAQKLLDVLDQLDAVDGSGLGLEAEPKEEYAASGASERLCLRGSDLMRQANLVAPGSVTRAALMLRAARSFCRGYLGKVLRADLDERQAFALCNAMVAGGLAVLLGDRRLKKRVQHGLRERPGRRWFDWRGATASLIDRMQRTALSASFWHYTNILDLLLARQVLGLALTGKVDEKDLAQLPDLLERALVRWPAPAEVESMLDRMRLIGEVLGPAGVASDRQQLAAAVRGIQLQLEAYGAGIYQAG